MEKKVVTYALVKTCWDQGGDYLDCFWPFIIRVMPLNKQLVNEDRIQQDVRDDSALEIPLHSLRTVLYRAQRRRYVDKVGTRYQLTDKGLQYLGSAETEKQVERRMNALFEDVKQFAKANLGLSLNTNQISNAMLSLLNANVEPLAQFFNPISSEQPMLEARITTKLTRVLTEYLRIAEQSKPDYYETFRDVFLGALLSTILNSENIDRVEQTRTKRFKSLQLFLDTNFVFSMLELHTPEFNEPARELLNLIQKHKFILKVFSFTVDEICRVINAYITEGDIYPRGIMIDTLFSTLKKKGWTKTDAREFIMTIEDKLSKLGTKVEATDDISLDNYDQPTSEIRSAIRRYKPEQQPFFQNHDLAAIDQITRIRKHPSRRVEFSKALFLTSDKRLSRYNFAEYGHRETGTISEVILDSLLTNIIWLKDPSQKVSLHSIIAAHSRDLFVDRKIWRKFYDTLKQVKQERNLDDEAVSTLFYGNFIEDELREFDEGQIDTITPQFVLEEIEKAVKSVKQKDEEKEKEFIRKLGEERSLVAQQKDSEWLEKLGSVRSRIRKESNKRASIFSIIGSSVVSLVLIGLLWILYELVGLPWLVPIILGGGGIIPIWSKLRSWLRRTLSEVIYKNRFKVSGLAELMNSD